MRFVFRIVPVTVVMGTIFFLSHQPGDSLHLPAFPGVDKLAHLTAYAFLALTLLWFFGERGQERLRSTALWTVVLCFVHGMTDEFHQSFIPQRSVSGLDIVADITGAVLIVALWLHSARMRQKVSVL